MRAKVQRISRGGYVETAKLLIVAILGSLFAALCAAPHVAADDAPIMQLASGKKACTYVVGFKGGDFSVFYEKVLVFGEKPALDEDGQPSPEWWVINLENPSKNGIDANGRIKAYNVPKEQVLFMDKKYGPVMVKHKMRLCRCPPSYWGAGDSGISAER